MGAAIRAAGAAALLACAPGAEGAVEPALATCLRGIESAFKSGDAGALRGSFSGKGKVRVDIKNVMPGPGSYGPGQLEVIFDRIFDENRTREFAFRDEDVTSSDGMAFARGRWVRRPRPGGSDTTDTLTFTLRQEEGAWRIHEIRSSR